MVLSEKETIYFYISIIVFTVLNYLIYEFLERKTVGIKIKISHRETRINPVAVVFLVISVLVALIPLVSRNCGADTQNYYRSYSNPFRQTHDLLFYYILRFLNRFTTDPKIGIGIIGTATIIPLFLIVSNNRRTYVRWLVILSYMTTLYFYNYNYVRIMLASTIIALAYSNLINKRIKTGLALLGISVFIHLSCIIVFAVYFVSLFLIKYRKTLVATSLILVFLFIRYPMAFLGLITYDRYTGYVETINLNNVSLGIGTTIIVFPLFLVVIYFNKRIQDRYIYNLFFISIIFYVTVSILGYYIAVASRVSKMCFTMNSLFMVPYILKNIEISKTERHVLYAFQICYCAFMYYTLQKLFGVIGIMPYYGG